MSIRTLRADDLDAVLALNNASVPHVNELDGPRLAAITAEAAHCAVDVREGAIAGMVVAFGPGAAYDSANYRWFCDAYDDFLYVDRIVVDDGRRGAGLGRAFYEWLWQEGAPTRITCEVNEVPPNLGSMGFHTALGFERVGALEHDGGKRVALLSCEPAPGGRTP